MELEGVRVTGQHAPVSTDKEAPEADALEQALPVSADDDTEMPEASPDPEAPEADRLEQATPVPFDED